MPRISIQQCTLAFTFPISEMHGSDPPSEVAREECILVSASARPPWGEAWSSPAPMLQHIDMGMLVLVLLLLRRGTLLPSWLPRSEARACTTASRCRLFASNEAKYAFHQAIQYGERTEPAPDSSTARARSPTRSDDSALALYQSLPSAPAMRI